MTIMPGQVADAERYILGLLSDADAADFKKRLAKDKALAAAVAEAEDALEEVLESVPGEPVPAALDQRIQKIMQKHAAAAAPIPEAKPARTARPRNAAAASA